MGKKKRFFFVVLAGLLLPSLLFTGLGEAAPFYEGKTITIIVSTKAGGGYDFYARLFAKYMEKYLPGSTVIVKNKPGAGHIIGLNAIYASKPDGLTFGTFTRTLALAQVAGLKGIKFDQAKMSWIGSACTELHSFIVVNKYKTLDDVLKAEKVRVVSEGIGALNYLEPILFSYMTGAKNIVITPNYGGSEMRLAVMRGEADGSFGSWHSWVKVVEEGNGHPVLFIGKKQPEGYENIPLLSDVIEDEKYKPIVDLLNSVNLLGRQFGGPPGIPQDRLAALRDAFKKACEDPELLEIAKKAERPIEYVSPEKVAAYTKNLLELPPEVVAIIKKAYGM